jgi:hypothetical protein
VEIGVILSHTNIVSECFIPSTLAREEITARIRAGEPEFEYRTLAHLPASHIAGVQGYFVNPFYMGGPTYWMTKFDFLKFLEYNKKFRITFFFTVPPIYLLIAKMDIVTDQFDALEIAISGAAPLGKELQVQASEKLGRGKKRKTFIVQTWGTSKTALIPPSSSELKSSGAPRELYEGCKAYVVKEKGVSTHLVSSSAPKTVKSHTDLSIGLSETTGSVTLMPWGEMDDTGSVSKLLPNMSIRSVTSF